MKFDASQENQEDKTLDESINFGESPSLRIEEGASDKVSKTNWKEEEG